MGRIAGRIAVTARCLLLSGVVLAGCDAGVEATQDNLSHFASVASELRRDARELDLLAKKVGYVKLKLEQRKSDIAEHAYTEELGKQRDMLIGRLTDAGTLPTPAVEDADPPTEPIEPAAPMMTGDALAGAVALHDQLFSPLNVTDNTLHNDTDYAWWVEELGLETAASASFTGSGYSGPADEIGRAVENCRTAWGSVNRAEACAGLLTNHLTPSHFAGVKKARLSELGSEIERLGVIQDQFAAESENRTISASKVMSAYGSSFDGLIIWGFPSLIAAVLLIVLFEGRRRRTGEAPIPDTLNVVTVLLLVSAIIILGLGGKIQPEALGTLIGGISGYVLGKSAQVLSNDRAKDDKVSAPPTPPVEAKVEAKHEAERKSADEITSDDPVVATAKG
jgi:hypothetical protein